MPKTIKNNKQSNKLRKTISLKQDKNTTIMRKNSHTVRVFLEILNMIKLFHWKTQSYAQHKATDALYANLNTNIDKFVEVLIGKSKKRIQMLDKKINLIDPNNDKEFKTKIYEYREFLINLDTGLNKKRDTDLISIRDDILVDINQFLYLMTFA
jgi:hypothetical protein